MTTQPEFTPLEAIAGNGIKCIRCIEAYIQLPEESKGDEVFRATVNDAVTFVPSWQTTMAGPNQMVMACVTVPVCLDHLQVQKPSPEQIAQRNGLLIPGQN